MNRMICKLVLISALTNSLHNHDSFAYTVPEPQIQVFSPRGLKVSVPDEDGINLFAFHGNINRPIYGLDAGQMSKDILRPNVNEWIFYDGDVKLHVGDKIYYWLFVIKDGLGYLYQNGYYEVKDIQPFRFNIDNTTKIKEENSTSRDKLIILACERLVLNLTETLVGLQSQVDSLQDTNHILKDIIEKQPNVSYSLTMIGGTSSLYENDPDSVVEEIIRRKLNLPVKVFSAEVQGNGNVTFKVRTLNEKISIIRAAKHKLKNSKFFITY